MSNLTSLLLKPVGWLLRNRRSGEENSALKRQGWDLPSTIIVTSASFKNGELIDDRHSAHGRGPNISPQLSWTNAPSGTRQFVLVFEDLDLPFNRAGIHTIGLLPADMDAAAEGELTPGHPRIRWIPGSIGPSRGYSGPNPLPGHGTHRYRFHIIALDRSVPATLPLDDIDDLDPYVVGRAIAHGSLEGHQRG